VPPEPQDQAGIRFSASSGHTKFAVEGHFAVESQPSSSTALSQASTLRRAGQAPGLATAWLWSTVISGGRSSTAAR
jgi:hypothetical protein